MSRATRLAPPAVLPEDLDGLHRVLLGWYSASARDLPWRRPGVGPWGVLVSEVMLQQTPVARVEPVWRSWMERWPTPADLAAEPPGEAVRAWGRLGYPRRALRLHAAAGAVVERHGGRVPADPDELAALPGVGGYTAAAVAAFAHGARVPVVDSNVRRVLARLVQGRELPPPHLTRAEVDLARTLLPRRRAATWSVAVMELGALVCTARSPRCEACPVLDRCRWQSLGRPAYDGPPRRGQAWTGTDRQCRGTLLRVVREGPASGVPVSRLEAAWPDATQASRCLGSLLEDGLVEQAGDDLVRLPA